MLVKLPDQQPCAFPAILNPAGAIESVDTIVVLVRLTRTR